MPRRVLVTRSREQAGPLTAALLHAGYEPVACPVLERQAPEDPAPLLAAVAGLAGYDWLVLTSGNALRALMDAGATADQPWPLIAAIGAATAQRCAEVGLATAFIPRHTTAEGLVAEWVPQLSPQARVLLPQAANARPVVANALRASHISVDVVTAYRTVPPATATDLESQAINAVTVASSATVDRLLAQVPRSRLDGAVWVAIGPATAQRCRDHGLGPVVVADEATDDGLVQAVSRATPPH